MGAFLSVCLAPLFQGALRLGLKLTGLTNAWDDNVVVQDPRAFAAIVLKGDLGLGVSAAITPKNLAFFFCVTSWHCIKLIKSNS